MTMAVRPGPAATVLLACLAVISGCSPSDKRSAAAPPSAEERSRLRASKHWCGTSDSALEASEMLKKAREAMVNLSLELSMIACDHLLQGPLTPGRVEDFRRTLKALRSEWSELRKLSEALDAHVRLGTDATAGGSAGANAEVRDHAGGDAEE